MIREVLIVGAGPAGTSLAIRLAKLGLRVKLVERAKFPREKLCGEFVSPECMRLFEEVGVRQNIASLRGSEIKQTIFYSSGGSTVVVPARWLGAENALGLSRSALDNAMLEAALDAGVDIRCETRLVGANTDGNRIRSVVLQTSGGARNEQKADLFVDAGGRPGAFSRLLRQNERSPGRPRYIAFNNHFRGAKTDEETCEMYLFSTGYGGVNRIEDGRFNFCFITKNTTGIEKDPERLLRKIIMAENSRARQTMGDAEPIREWIAVPIWDYGFRKPRRLRNFMKIGDAGAFIDPFTGSGILMALESAKRAAECIEIAGLDARAATDLFVEESRAIFASRLLSAALLRRAAFSPLLSSAAIALAGRLPRAGRYLARITRR